MTDSLRGAVVRPVSWLLVASSSLAVLTLVLAALHWYRSATAAPSPEEVELSRAKALRALFRWMDVHAPRGGFTCSTLNNGVRCTVSHQYYTMPVSVWCSPEECWVVK